MQKKRDDANNATLKCLVRYLQGTDRRLILRSKNTGAWLSVRGTSVSGTVLSATDSWDFFCAYYNVTHLNLHSRCDGCGTAFKDTRALSCSKGDLAIARHNEVRDKLPYLAQRAFIPALVHA